MNREHRRAYRILGIRPDSSQDDVKQAYRDLAQVWHPDRFQHSGRLHEKAQRNLKRINEAFALLKDYEPVGVPTRTSRLSITMSAVMDIGDIMQSRDIQRGPDAVRPPAGRRGGVVLGVGDLRPTGEWRAPKTRYRRWVMAAIAIVLAVAAVVYFQLV